MSERRYYSQEAAERAERERIALALIVALMGVGLGTVIALMFAPQAGEKTRKQLGKQVSHVVSDGREAVSKVSDDVRSGASKVRDEVEDRMPSIRN